MQDSEDYYVVFEGSDEDNDGISSDEEDDESFWGELYKFQNPKKSKQKQDADDFEREMNQELNSKMGQLQGKHQFAICDASTSGAATQKGAPAEDGLPPKQNSFYDESYFDSDSDDEEAEPGVSKRKQRKRHPVMSNDDLFYDPDMDDADQKWVDERRRYNSSSAAAKKVNATNANSNASQRQLPNSDAVLNCPACMCTLCRDCQRHSLYKGQYRAMFVFNCEVDTSQTLNYPSSKQKKFKKKQGMPCDASAPLTDDLFHPVKCAECKTEVAVYDKDEVYHFHNVLSSFA